MAMRLHEWGTQVCCSLELMSRWTEFHDEAFGGAAGFEELGEFDLDDLESVLLELAA